MCGICGIHGLERIDQPAVVVRRMNNALKHRGPNASGEFITDDVALGHQRLSIIDLTSAANQPMHSPDGRYVLIYNGELYNYQEIQAQIVDYPFLTNSDTEVVLAAFQKWGIAAVERFNGMFAMALWDDREKELFLIRDRLGIKPLYYAHVGQSLLFASEIRALLQSEMVERRSNINSIVDFMRYQTVHAPDTIIEGVKMLMPGHWMKITDTDYHIEPYWKLTESPSFEALNMTNGEIKTQVADLVSNAVKRRLVADVPFGAFLSGGIDSSLIVGLMAQHHSAPINTFSVSFEEEAFSEARYARMIAEKFNTNHTDIRLAPIDFLNELPHALQSMDHPSGDGPNTFVVSKVTKEAGITMALSGTGGDELFGGYEIFKRFVQLHNKTWLLSFPKGMRGIVGNYLRYKQPGIASDKTAQVLKAGRFDLEYIYWVSRLLFFDKRTAQIINTDALPANNVYRAVENEVKYGSRGFQFPKLSQVSIAEIATYLQNVLLRDADQMSMAHALEVRVPFMDHQLVEFVLGIPDDVKYPQTPKQLLVNSFPELLPDEVVNRPKMGFTLPWNEWLRAELRHFTADHLSDLSARPFFKQSGIQQLWSDFEQQKPDVNWAHVWNLVVLENWLRQNKVDV